MFPSLRENTQYRLKIFFMLLKNQYSPGIVIHTFNPNSWSQRQDLKLAMKLRITLNFLFSTSNSQVLGLLQYISQCPEETLFLSWDLQNVKVDSYRAKN